MNRAKQRDLRLCLLITLTVSVANGILLFKGQTRKNEISTVQNM